MTSAMYVGLIMSHGMPLPPQGRPTVLQHLLGEGLPNF